MVLALCTSPNPTYFTKREDFLPLKDGGENVFMIMSGQVLWKVKYSGNRK